MFLMALIGLLFAAGHAQAQALKKQIVGTWSIMSAVNEVDGKKTDLYGPNPQGQIIFTRDGNFSFTTMRPGRMKFAANSRTAGTPEENKEAMGGYIAEFGTYTFNPDGAVMLHIVGCSFPNWDGTDQKRSLQVKGDELTWSNSAASTGSGKAIITAKRAK
jgi:hypothetical protein